MTSHNASVVNDSRYQMQFRFWLNVMSEQEEALAQYAHQLKEQRRFAQTIRDALSLIRDLRAGRVVVLLALFPWIEDHFRPATTDWLTGELTQLKALLQQRDGAYAARPNQRHDVAALPDLEVKLPTSKPTGKSGRVLLLQVWLASNQAHIDLFKDDDLQLVLGHPAFNQSLIQAEIQRRAKEVAAPVLTTPAPQPRQSRPIKGSEVALPAPNFDDLDLL